MSKFVKCGDTIVLSDICQLCVDRKKDQETAEEAYQRYRREKPGECIISLEVITKAPHPRERFEQMLAEQNIHMNPMERYHMLKYISLTFKQQWMNLT